MSRQTNGWQELRTSNASVFLFWLFWTPSNLTSLRKTEAAQRAGNACWETVVPPSFFGPEDLSWFCRRPLLTRINAGLGLDQHIISFGLLKPHLLV